MPLVIFYSWKDPSGTFDLQVDAEFPFLLSDLG
jgi:hypothetical protein